MKLSTYAVIGVGVGAFLFALAIETEVEYENIAISGITFLGMILLWIGTLLMDLNEHFEKEEELRSERNVQE